MITSKGSLWTRGGLTWWGLGVRLWRQLGEDEVPGRCAELAYYFLFSVFPLLLFLTALLAYLTRLSEGVRWNLFWLIGHLSPSGQVTDLLNRTLAEIAARRSGGKLSLGFLISIWVASNGMIAVSRSLNRAFDLAETRPWWLRRLVALGLIIGFAVLLIGALGLVIYGGAIADALSEHLTFGPYLVALWHLARWLLVAAFLVLSFDMIYNFAPDLGGAKGRARRRWGTPGALTGVALFVGASIGFRYYLSYYNSYTRAYGSLGAVIVLLVWFYLTAFSIIMGGEVNSEIAREVERKPVRRKK
ncbi:MAG TPA: YihY/virulence factor BrkB family protein [Thermoanaerobaculia bacterium]|jgi:membrane protein|nr:YihY/virulence factor BrkB family protein [Thermoanaerobaculia bacterium]